MLAIFGSMQFKEIPGQHEIKARLIQSVRSNRVSHALLLSGTPGSGHFALALAFAQYLQCQSPGEDDSCGVCPSCHQAAGLMHPDIHFVFPVARTTSNPGEPASDDLIAEWRQFVAADPFPVLEEWYSAMKIENKQAGIFKREAQEILRKLSFKSYASDYKVMIFWMPEKMNITAANKLLKIIEEPADHTVFLFVTEDTDEILPTILSRTQLIKVPAIAREDLLKKLRQEFPEMGDELESIARKSQGDYVTAKSMIRLNEAAMINRDRFIHWMRICFALKVPEMLAWVDEMSGIGRERQKLFLTYGLEMIRENFLLNRGVPELAVFDPEEQAFSSRFNAFIHPGNVEGLMKEFSDAISQITMNANPKILLTDMCFQMNRLLRMPPA
jgi:DNA polymerase-3 subunit delta'